MTRRDVVLLRRLLLSICPCCCLSCRIHPMISLFSSKVKVSNNTDEYVCVMGLVRMVDKTPYNNCIYAIGPGESREVIVDFSAPSLFVSPKICIAVIVRVDACDISNLFYVCDCFYVDSSSELIINTIDSLHAYIASTGDNVEEHQSISCREINIANFRKCVNVYSRVPGRVCPDASELLIIENSTTVPLTEHDTEIVVKVLDVTEVNGVTKSFKIKSSFDHRDVACVTDVAPGKTLTVRYIPLDAANYQIVYPSDWTPAEKVARNTPKKFAALRALKYLQLRNGYRFKFQLDGITNTKTTCIVTKLPRSAEVSKVLTAEDDFLKIIPRKGMMKKHTLRLKLVVRALQMLFHAANDTPQGAVIDNAVLTCAMASRDVYSSLKAEAWHYICSKDVDITCNELIPWAMWKSNAAADTAVLVFRGTHLSESLQDILHNISVQTVRLKGTRSAHVHSGFNAAVENVFDDITAALRASGVKNFNVTGHSLGGALAQLFALKYMLQHPQPAESATLKRVITFGAPMTLWCLGEELHAEDAQYLHPWMDVCVNYIHRADPVPMLPRMLTDRHCWNLMVEVFSQLSWYGFISQNFVIVPSEGEIPPGLFQTLSFASGFRPPGNTVMLLGDAAPMILNPRAMQKLATTFDTVVCLRDGFSHHWLGGYISAVENALSDLSEGDTEEGTDEGRGNDEEPDDDSDDLDALPKDGLISNGISPAKNGAVVSPKSTTAEQGDHSFEAELDSDMRYFLVDNSRNEHAVAFRDFRIPATLCDDIPPVSGGEITEVPYEMTNCVRMVYPMDWRSFPGRLTSIPALKYLRLRNGYRFRFITDRYKKKTTVVVSRVCKSGGDEGGVSKMKLTADEEFLKIVPRKGMQNDHTLRLLLVVDALQQLFHTNETLVLSSFHYDNDVLSCALASRDIYSSIELPKWHHLSSKNVDLTRNELTKWALWKTSSSVDKAILVFRGTDLEQSVQDIFHDAAFQTARLQGTRSAHVHSGFNAAVENVFDDITAALRASGVKNFNVTGHSLGGALAQLFALKYMLQHPQPAESATLKRVITFGAPMTLWCLGEELHAEDAQYLHPWMDVCVNYIHRADPVPMTPRLLSCRYIWNTFLDMIESQVPLLGFVNPSYFMNLRISSRGEPPALFSTLSFACGYRPPGVTVMLLGDAAPMILNPRAMQKLATTFDTIVCFKDKFSHHKMAGYISAVERASDQMCSVDVDNDQNEFEFNDEPLSTAEGEIVCSVPPIPSRPSPSTDRYKL